VRSCAAVRRITGRRVSPGRPSIGADQPGDQRGEKDLAGHRLENRHRPAEAASRGEVAVAQGGQGGEAEVLVGAEIGRLAVREEISASQAVDGAEDGGEHQPDEHVRAQRGVDALHGDGIQLQHAVNDDHHGRQQQEGGPDAADTSRDRTV
jgi:hypothetical protein